MKIVNYAYHIGARKFLLVLHLIAERQQRTKKNYEEPIQHRDPSSHDFFSNNANKVLALLFCIPTGEDVQDVLINKFLALTPKKFVKRHFHPFFHFRLFHLSSQASFYQTHPSDYGFV